MNRKSRIYRNYSKIEIIQRDIGKRAQNIGRIFFIPARGPYLLWLIARKCTYTIQPLAPSQIHSLLGLKTLPLAFLLAEGLEIWYLDDIGNLEQNELMEYEFAYNPSEPINISKQFWRWINFFSNPTDGIFAKDSTVKFCYSGPSIWCNLLSYETFSESTI